MDGVHPPGVCGVWNGGGVCCCQSAPVRVAQPASRSSQCSTRQYCGHTAYCSLSSHAMWVVSICPRSLCGGVSSDNPPLLVVGGVAITEGRAPCGVVGGMVMEGRWCYWRPVCVLLSPFRLRGGPVEWLWWCVPWCPRLWIGAPLSYCLAPSLCCSAPPCIILVSLPSCVSPCLLRGEEVRWRAGACSAILFSLSSLCLLSHHCWFSGVSL